MAKIVLRTIGVPWYRREDYNRLREHPNTDLIDDFEDWEKHAEQMFRALVAKGHPLEKVMFDADEFLAFARLRHNGKIDAGVRSEFAFILAAKKYGRDH